MPKLKAGINEKGAILLTALAILVFLSILGAMALTTTSYELKLSGNDKSIARLKTRAESTAAAAVEHLENLSGQQLKDSDWESSSRLPWFSRGANNQFDTIGSNKFDDLASYIKDMANWIQNPDSPSNCMTLLPDKDFTNGEHFLDKFPNCQFQVIDVEISQGSSLQVGNTFGTMHNLYITGVSTQGNAKRMVQFGYRKNY